MESTEKPPLRAEVLDAYAQDVNQLTIARYVTATRECSEPEANEPGFGEDVLRLDPDGRLVGVVSRAAHAAPTAPIAVILNAGVLHRVGPHRLHVRLARRLAGVGVTTLRLDLGGIGDSAASSDAATFRESAVADTRVAITALGTQRAVIFGVCSGADNAFATALVDERVAGIVLVDPYVYENWRSRLRALRSRIAARRRSREVMRSGLRVARHELQARFERLRRASGDAPVTGRDAPPIAIYRAQLNALVARGVRIFAIYSGTRGAKYNHPDQLFELFPELRGRVDRAYFPHANHTFAELDVQAELIAAVSSWMTAQFR